MAACHLERRPGRLKSFGGVLTQRLQHPVPGGGAGLDDDHGPFDEPADGVEDCPGKCTLVCDDLFSRRQGPAALEDREPVEHPLFGLRQQLVAPVDGGAQCLLPFLRGAGAGGEEGEPAPEPHGHLDGRERRHPGSGELEGEWDAVEGAADDPDGGQVVGVEHQPRAYGAGPFGEQLRRRVVEHLARRGVLGGRFQRADGDLHLVGDGERFAAGGDDGDVGAAAEDVVDEDGGGVHDVLAVVDQKQHAALGQERDEPVAQVVGRGGAVQRHAEGVGERDRHLVGGGDRRQPHPEGTVGVVRRRADDGGERQGRLPGAAGADEGEQPYAAEELGDGVQLGVAADERAQHGGQVRRRRAVLVGAGAVCRHRHRSSQWAAPPEQPTDVARRQRWQHVPRRILVQRSRPSLSMLSRSPGPCPAGRRGWRLGAGPARAVTAATPMVRGRGPRRGPRGCGCTRRGRRLGGRCGTTPASTTRQATPGSGRGRRRVRGR